CNTVAALPGRLLSSRRTDPLKPKSRLEWATRGYPISPTWRCIYCEELSAMDDAKRLVNRFVEELWNERRLDVADAIFAKDCVTHQLRSGVPVDAVPRGPQAIKE